MANPSEVCIHSLREFTRCILCGHLVGTQSVVWLDTVRILYPVGGEVVLSGLSSHYHKAALEVSPDSRISWDENEDYEWAIACCPDPGGSYFLFHECCWQAFQGYFQTEDVQYDRLYDVLRKVMPFKGLNHAPYSPSPLRPLRGADLLATVKHAPTPPRRSPRRTKCCLQNPSDVFRRLPVEIKEEIASLLPLRDFLSLRHASRAMTPLFASNQFWRSRFRVGGERAYLQYLLRDPAVDGEQVEWREIYQASSQFLRVCDTAMKTYEVTRWIQDTLRAEDGLQAPPLDFYGSALQHYHNDSCAKGRRIERVKISRPLATIGISYVVVADSTIPPRRYRSKRGGALPPERGPGPDISALEFIDQDGNSTIIGSKHTNAWTCSHGELYDELNRYWSGRAPAEWKWPFDSPGVQVLQDAESFTGFNTAYSTRGILGLDTLKRDSRSTSLPPIYASHPGGSRSFWMALNQVEEVVATFERSGLIDLGIRGFGPRERNPHIRPYAFKHMVYTARYGDGELVTKVLQELEASRKDAGTEEDSLARMRAEISALQEAMRRQSSTS
ncbi:hypothetical protein BJX61DRAFT_545605 [Aspergillus egyptiacus]|nr:hypothetical protein BJX61DRAFT_545605 [Aspergillus egyptiacus]